MLPMVASLALQRATTSVNLDLASGAKLDLLPGEDGKSQTTDCVLVNPKLEWNDSAEHLLADQSKLD